MLSDQDILELRAILKEASSLIKEDLVASQWSSRITLLAESLGEEDLMTAQHPSWVEEVSELIDQLKQRMSPQEISEVVYETYGKKTEVKDILEDHGINR